MVKIELRDENFLQLAAAATGAYGLHMFAAPRNAQSYYLDPLEPKNDTLCRWFGQQLVNTAVTTAVASRTTDSATRKDFLKASGACWAGVAAHTAYNVHKKHQKKESGWTNAALQVGMAGLLLWRGFKKTDKTT